MNDKKLGNNASTIGIEIQQEDTMNNFIKMNLKYLVKLKHFWKTLLKLTQKEMQNLNRLTTGEQTESVIKYFPNKEKSRISFTGEFYQTFKEE